WTSLFHSELETRQQSVVFVKRMMALAVSCITYLRGIFPEVAYRSRYLEGVDTKKASVLLVRKLFLLMQNLDALPADVSLSMKLYYYDDVTPPDYEPPGFVQGVCDSLWFDGRAVHFKVGDVHTPFHTLKFQVAADHERVAKLQQGNHLWESAQSSAQQGLKQLKRGER
ncbi:hypothetical protein JZ751_025121, partial [Albula glossodonta]